MFIAYQLPVADARLFAPAGTHRFERPDWPLPAAEADFIRGFGVVRARRLGNDTFQDEVMYAGAAGALRFDAIERRVIGTGQAALTPTVLYRRLYCSAKEQGAAVVRLQAAFTDWNPKRPKPAVQMAAADWGRLVEGLLELPVKIQSSREAPFKGSLWTCGKALAKTYAAATEPTKERTPESASLVVHGQPLILLEYAAKERGELPQFATTVDPNQLLGADLSHLWADYRGRRVGIWLLRRDSAPRDVVRRIRLTLLRLHAEHQVLRAILSLWMSLDVPYTRGTPQANRFDAYLNWATRVLDTGDHGGVSAASIRDVLVRFEALVEGGQLALLGERLQDVRRQVRVKVLSQSGAGHDAIPPDALEQLRRVRVFVSYSHADAKYLAEDDRYSLLSFLKGLERDGVEFWYDREINTGDQWDDRIREEIDRSDIALVLVSQPFLNSAYCRSVEARQFVEGARERGLVIFPVILSPCAWEQEAWLKAIQHQPLDSKTIETDYASEGDRKALYLEIMNQLRNVAVRHAQT